MTDREKLRHVLREIYRHERKVAQRYPRHSIEDRALYHRAKTIARR